ncbi:MAG: hypothetical protein AAF679_10055, partial [Pseudomonadota bacterium]
MGSDKEAREARDISDMLLRKTGAALAAGDCKALGLCFRLPFELKTPAGSAVFKTTEHLRTVFERVTTYHQSLNVTELDRSCLKAEFRDENTVVATHLSRFYSEGVLVGATHTALSVLVREEGEWR